MGFRLNGINPNVLKLGGKTIGMSFVVCMVSPQILLPLVPK
jgi:hypothetical protein